MKVKVCPSDRTDGNSIRRLVNDPRDEAVCRAWLLMKGWDEFVQDATPLMAASTEVSYGELFHVSTVCHESRDTVRDSDPLRP